MEKKEKMPYGYWDYDHCFEAAKECKARTEFYKKYPTAYINARKSGWLKDYIWFEPRFLWDYDKCYEEAKKYKTRSEFMAKASGAYAKAKDNGWLKDYTWFIEKCKPSGYWTYENCYEEAKKYKSKISFKKGCPGAYNVSYKNKWIDDYTWFERPVSCRKKWYRENCYEEAKRYKTRTDFQYGSCGAYKVAKNNGWLDDYTWFIEKYKPNGYWDNYEKCYEEAKRYKTRTDFEYGSHSAYKVANKNGWLKDYTWFIEKCKPNGYWDNYDNCYNEALNYKTKADFQRGCGAAYTSARKNKWLNDYTWFKKGVERGLVYWIYSYEDKEHKVVYVGLTFRKERHSQHRSDKYDSVFKYFKNNVPKPRILMEGLSAEDAQYYEDWYKLKYAEAGWKLLNKAKTGVGTSSLGNAIVKWSYEKCYNEAKKYENRGEFRKGNLSAYNAAQRNKWLDDFFGESGVKPYGYWNYDNCRIEAKKYTSRSEFQRGCISAYNNSKDNKWLDEFFPKAA